MPIILSSPVTFEDTTPVARNYPMTWTGVDGRVWRLTKPGAPNPRMAPGVKGLHMPRMVVHSSSSPLVPGIDIDEGYELPERSVYWPLLFRAASAEQWQEDHADFFRSFHPVRTGIWTVGEGRTARTLPLTGSFDGSYTFTRDPFLTRLALIGVELVAPRPLWRGLPITQKFAGASSRPFIPEGGGPPYYISPGATFQDAKISNPGDEPSYLTWEVEGPQPAGIKLGVGEGLIEVPFAIAEGSTLLINTNPAEQYATLDGVDAARDLGFQIFAPIPAGGDVDLVIISDGEGSIRATHVPLYWMAF